MQNSGSVGQSEVADWIERLARFGYAAKGVVYVLVGVLAVQAAFSWGGKVTGSKGAFRTIASQPFGQVMLILVAVGLVGYVVWRFVEAFRDPEHNDSGAGSVVRRISYAVSGLIYAGLAFSAFKIALGSGGGSGSGSSEKASTLLAQPFGQWLLGLVGVAAVAYGLYSIYKGFTTKFRRKLKLLEMKISMVKWAKRVGQFGLIAKGIVGIIVGYFCIQAARASSAAQVKTTEGVLQTLQEQPYGAYLMGVVALGLLAYGVHMLVQARYRRISPEA